MARLKNAARRKRATKPRLPDRRDFTDWELWRAAIEQFYLDRGDIRNALRALTLLPTDPNPFDY